MKEILELAIRTKEQKLHKQIMYKELKGQTQIYIGYKSHHGLSISLGEPSSLVHGALVLQVTNLNHQRDIRGNKRLDTGVSKVRSKPVTGHLLYRRVSKVRQSVSPVPSTVRLTNTTVRKAWCIVTSSKASV